jgi:CHAT domain-containing protein/tetratricopeptide (TPR) repeat protein
MHRHAAIVAIAAIVLAVSASAAAPRHLRELPALERAAHAIEDAALRHAFDDADARLEEARREAAALGPDGELALIELDGFACQIDIERRREEQAADVCAAAYQRIVARFGEATALRSAVAVPLVNTMMLRSSGGQGEDLLERIAAAMQQAWGDDAEVLAGIDHLRGGFRYYDGDYATARQRYREAYDRLRRQGGDRSFLAVVSAGQAALMDARLGNTDAAIAELRRLQGSMPDDPKLSAIALQLVLRNLGNAYFAAGRPSEALRAEERGWQTIRETLGEDDPNVLESLHNIASLLGDLGRHADALALQQRLLPRFERRYGETSEFVLLTLNNMAFNRSALGDPAAAVELFRRCVELSTRMSGADHAETLYYRQQLAVALAVSGAPEQAIPILEPIDARNRDVASPAAAATRSHLYTARAIALRTAESRAALVEHAREVAQRYGVASPVAVQTAMRGGALLLKQGARGDAQALLDLGIEGVDRQLASRWAPTERRAFFSRYVDAYRSAAILAGSSSAGCSRALGIAERARGHGLLEAVTRQRALEASDVPVDERVRLLELVAARERIESEALQAPTGSAERVAADARAAAASAGLAQDEHRLETNNPGFARIRSTMRFDIDASRRALAPGEAFVEYVVATGEAMAIVVRRGRAPRCVSLGPTERIARPLENLRRAIAARAGTSMLRDVAANELSARLLAPLWRDVADARRLVVSPDGPLATLPFDLLPLPGRRVRLVERHEVSYAQSLAVHAAIRERFTRARASWPQDLLAFGGPRYAEPVREASLASLIDDERAKGVAATTESGAAAKAPLRMLGRRWAPLPGAEREARAVAALFARSAALTGADASEDRLQRLASQGELEHYRYLLFATHAYLSTDVPSLSAVVLSLPGTEEADGYVTASEWPAYRLRSELVVLSGCETGLGAEGAGDGVLGLPYALFVAGNRNTLVSLWPVADEATSTFMVAFFGRLRAGETQASALANTKRAFVRDRRFADPMIWASFVLYGG